MAMNKNTAGLLFGRMTEIASAVTAGHGDRVLAAMRDVLTRTCGEALAGSGSGYGNLFSQIDILCNRHSVTGGDRRAVHTLRRHCNHPSSLTDGELMSDLRALGVFIAAVSGQPLPAALAAVMPRRAEAAPVRRIDEKYVRCIVKSREGSRIYAATEQDTDTGYVTVDCSGDGVTHILDLISEGTQLNLLDCEISAGRAPDGSRVLRPSFVIYEPDYLIDISSLAACFKDYGHHPLVYTLDKLKPRANSRAILLGGFAGAVLDAMISGDGYDFASVLRRHFRDNVMEYCAAGDFDAESFKADALRQADNIRQAAGVLFDATVAGGRHYDRRKAVLEPSFICERLGLQGRVDLMTCDFGMLTEQKSGRNRNIETGRRNEYGSYYTEPHYVQLLLYYGVLRYNFAAGRNTDLYLLYSKFVPESGLLQVTYYRRLFAEAIALRNRITATDMAIARRGFEAVIDRLTPDELNTRRMSGFFYDNYLRPSIEAVTRPLQTMSPLERKYFCRMMTFVCRERIAGRVGVRPEAHGCAADLWNMSSDEKTAKGSIYLGLTVTDVGRDDDGRCLLTMDVPAQSDDFVSDFRCGDMVYVYKYIAGEEPDICRSMLYRGTMKEIHSRRVTVALTGDQRIVGGTGGLFAVEHGVADATSSAAVRGLHRFITSPVKMRRLLLALRAPESDDTLTLTRSYDTCYDGLLLKARRARDYFLLVGPPGTGKTSRALRYIVEEELTSCQASVLLMAYTNRAVDEICGMLDDAGLDYLRIGNKYSCDARYRDRLPGGIVGQNPTIGAMRRRIAATRVIVGTTSMLQARPYIMELKTFSLAVVDEAGQILEPDIIGILSALCSRFILIGDHKQLPAVVSLPADETVVDDADLNAVGLTDCRKSLFERLLAVEKHAGRTAFVGVLNRQGRMHPDVVAFPAEMFYRNENLVPVPLSHQTDTDIGYAVSAADDVDEVLRSRRMVFIPSEKGDDPLAGKSNISEARIVADVMVRVRRMWGDRFDASSTLGVIVPYRNQIALIRKETDKTGDPLLRDVSIDTVERYQGSQRDIIIYSFTARDRYQTDFLTSGTVTEDGRCVDRRLNVVLTRARRQTICTGNEQVLACVPLYRRFMDYVRKSGGWLRLNL